EALRGRTAPLLALRRIARRAAASAVEARRMPEVQGRAARVPYVHALRAAPYTRLRRGRCTGRPRQGNGELLRLLQAEPGGVRRRPLVRRCRGSRGAREALRRVRRGWKRYARRPVGERRAIGVGFATGRPARRCRGTLQALSARPVAGSIRSAGSPSLPPFPT